MTKPPDHTPSEARLVPRLPIDSSNIASVGYSEARRVLAIEFLSSRLFLHYYEVPPEVFEAFGLAPSRGAFYAKQIRGKFTAKPMSGLCPKCAAWGYIGERCEGIDGAACDGIVREVDRTHKD
jgi:hypothetical protein